MRWSWIVAVVAACDAGPAPTAPPASAPPPAPASVPAVDAAVLDEAMCRELSNGKASCAELEPELARLRAATDRYLKRQSEIFELGLVARDPKRSAAERRTACDRIHALVVPSESGMLSVPSECAGSRRR